MAVSFDTHKAVTRLRRKAGFDEHQAMGVVETVSDVLVANLVTREDMDMLGTEMKADLAALRGEMKADMAALHGEMKASMATLRGEMHAAARGRRADSPSGRRPPII